MDRTASASLLHKDILPHMRGWTSTDSSNKQIFPDSRTERPSPDGRGMCAASDADCLSPTTLFPSSNAPLPVSVVGADAEPALMRYVQSFSKGHADHPTDERPEHFVGSTVRSRYTQRQKCKRENRASRWNSGRFLTHGITLTKTHRHSHPRKTASEILPTRSSR